MTLTLTTALLALTAAVLGTVTASCLGAACVQVVPWLDQIISPPGDDGMKITDWMLVCVSALQVWLLRRQMQIMENQRDIMAGQLTAAAKAAEASAQNATAAAVSADMAGATLKQMQDTASMQLRAYISVDSVKMSEDLHEPRFTVITRNSGQTPAYTVRNHYRREIAEFPLRHRLQADHPGDVGTYFTMSSGQQAADQGLGGVISDDDWDQMKAGNKAIYIYGIILYRDVFGIDHQTEFCYFCGGPAGMPAHRYLTAYTTGNEAT